MTHRERAKDILKRYHSDKCTELERAWVEDWMMYGEHEAPAMENDELLVALHDLRKDTLPKMQKTKSSQRWLQAAAILLIILSAGIILQREYTSYRQSQQQFVGRDIGPGGSKAVLTLSNGNKITLDANAGSTLNKEATGKLSKNNRGQLVYEVGETASSSGKINSISTPAGGEFIVILQDGSRVQLNARSTLHFPTRFSKAERRVKINGEAYFEVSHDASRPFQVETHDQTVEVLGTHFNLKAYDDERYSTTTLLEGSVRISKGSSTAILVPGEQAKVDKELNSIEVTTVEDRDASIAWTTGLFEFNHADLRTVMKELARWYDIQVVYEGEGEQRLFSGAIHKNLSLFQALELLNYTNVRFSTDGKRITISQ